MRCKHTALARFPQQVGCRAFGTKYAPSKVSIQSTLQPTLSQHYSQHYSQHSENTANHSISRNLHTFRYKMKNSSDSHGPSARLYVFAKYILSVDGGNLAPLLQRRFLTAPYPLLNIDIVHLQKQICSNDGNLAPPQTEQLSMLKRRCGDASSSHKGCLLCRWCKISSITVPYTGFSPQTETQVHNNDPDSSGELSGKGLVSVLTETNNTEKSEDDAV